MRHGGVPVLIVSAVLVFVAARNADGGSSTSALSTAAPATPTTSAAPTTTSAAPTTSTSAGGVVDEADPVATSAPSPSTSVEIASTSSPPPTPTTSRDINPLAGQALYRVPGGEAEQQAAAWQQTGRDDDAALIRKIADQPIAVWFGEDPNVSADVDALVTSAAEVGQLPVLVAYDIPGRDCGGFSSGGARSGADYLEWIDEFAAGVADRPAVIVLEPDAVAQTVDGCLSGDRAAERLALLKSAVEALSANPNARVYLDAGNPGWSSPARLIGALRQAGAEEAWGLAVNVSNFYGTDESVAYGTELSAALHGRHVVVDTSRNGNGPYTGQAHSPKWCNPPGRALGVAPTTDTGRSLVDAFLWVKVPGESDGECQHADPPAGRWWPEYALGLAAGSG
jgi:endoglucanase